MKPTKQNKEKKTPKENKVNKKEKNLVFFSEKKSAVTPPGLSAPLAATPRSSVAWRPPHRHGSAPPPGDACSAPPVETGAEGGVLFLSPFFCKSFGFFCVFFVFFRGVFKVFVSGFFEELLSFWFLLSVCVVSFSVF